MLNSPRTMLIERDDTLGAVLRSTLRGSVGVCPVGHAACKQRREARKYAGQQQFYGRWSTAQRIAVGRPVALLTSQGQGGGPRSAAGPPWTPRARLAMLGFFRGGDDEQDARPCRGAPGCCNLIVLIVGGCGCDTEA